MTEMRRVPVDPKGKWTAPEDIPPPEPPPPPLDDDAAAEECACPRLDPEDWHEVESDWSDATFARTSVAAVLGVPLKFGQVRERVRAIADAAGAAVPDDAMLLIGPGRVKRPLMLEVEVEGDPESMPGIVMPGGIAFTRLLPAPWGEMKNLARETEAIARKRYGRAPDTLWVWYLTCTHCSSAREYETLFVAHYKKAPASVTPTVVVG